MRTRDGYDLAATVFRPPATTRVERVVLICSAMGVRRGYYFPFAEYLAERGFAVIAFDYRGIGNSAPPSLRGFAARLSDWGKLDLPALIEWAGRTFPGRRLSVVAHSVGGQILGLAPNNSAVSDLLAVGVQSGYWRHWSGLQRLRVMTLWFLLIPFFSRALGYFPASAFGLGENLPAGVAREWAWWGRHPDYLAGRIDEAERRGYDGYRGRLLAYSASDDTIAPLPAVKALLVLYPGAELEHRHVKPADLGAESIGHFGYFRESIGSRLWPAQVRWLSGGTV